MEDPFLAGKRVAAINLVIVAISAQLLHPLDRYSRHCQVIYVEALRWLAVHDIRFANESDEEEFLDELLDIVEDTNESCINSADWAPNYQALIDEDLARREWEVYGFPHTSLVVARPAYTKCAQVLQDVVQEYVLNSEGDCEFQESKFQEGIQQFYGKPGLAFMRYVSSECLPINDLHSIPREELKNYLDEEPDYDAQNEIDMRIIRSDQRARQRARADRELRPDESEVEYKPVGRRIPKDSYSHVYRPLPVTCSICQDEITSEQGEQGVVVSTPCGHLFHAECLDQWVNESAMETSNTCPECRTEICEKRERKHVPT